MSARPCDHEGSPQRVVQVPDVPILTDWGHADCVLCAEEITACRRCGRTAWQVEAAAFCQPFIGPRTHDWWTGPRREWFAR